MDDWELLDEDSDDDKKVEAYPTHVKNKPQKKEVDVKGRSGCIDCMAAWIGCRFVDHVCGMSRGFDYWLRHLSP